MQNLYRHFDNGGRLLYVGVSLSAIRRLSEHSSVSHWFSDIATVTIEQFENRDAVLAAERKAIREENPLHNLKRPSPAEQARAEKARADESRDDLLRRVAQFNPTYSVAEVADALGMSTARVKAMIENGGIGSVCVGEKRGQSGAIIRKLRVTGWQLIEYIEHLESVNQEQGAKFVQRTGDVANDAQTRREN